MKDQSAFSLVELMVSIVIIALVSGVAVSAFSSVQKSGRDTQRQSDLRTMQSALQQYLANEGRYPSTLATELSNGSALTNCSGKPIPCTVTRTYLSKIPKDPAGTAYYYRAIVNANTQETACDLVANAEVNTCYAYLLCAKLETPPSGSSCYSSSYNFQLTPL